MTLESILPALAILVLLAAVGFALWTHLRTRRMLDTLDQMLDDATRGDFQESLYDESRLSALETRMAHYLSASTVSAKNLAEEKDKLKKLSPADVSAETLAGEKITAKLTNAPGNGAPIDGLKVTTENGWFAARPSGTEDIYKIYAESFKGEEHLEKINEEARAIVAKAIA